MRELAHSRKRGAGLVRRAQIILHAVEGRLSPPEIAARMGLCGSGSSAVESWIDPAAEPVYAVVDNLNTHSALDVLLFNLAHLRREFVFQPKYAAYLNLSEPRWHIPIIEPARVILNRTEPEPPIPPDQGGGAFNCTRAGSITRVHEDEKRCLIWLH